VANPFFGRGPLGVVLGQQPPLPGAAKPLSEKPGDRIGRYKLLEKIGEGGMGVVYMAEQQEDVRRRVALKVIKLGMDTAQVVARFEAERQALALMDHPNIAKVLDAGATDTGRPFFVMELVQGVPITEFCKKNQLSVEQRVNLFVPICQAIQSAHQKGIIHRDLKPGNILVTLTAGLPHPIVIDFGVAKATNQKLTEKTFFTNFGAMIGTPAYMSPEQAEMSRLDVDTRSDIYSLGALFYELLTDTTPFPEERLRSAGYDEMRRIIMEEEPERPSTRLRRKSLAARSGFQPSAFSSQISTDLDWVVMKCLEKDPERRYATADALASDVQRHLGNEPVLARPPSAAYRLKKLVQRNKLVFAAAAAVAAALVAGLGVSSWLYLREKTARQQAVAAKNSAATEAAKSGQVARFLADMLKSVGPSVAVGRDPKMLRDILDKTAQRVGKDLKGQPAVEAKLRNVIGNVYRELDAYTNAEAMHRAAWELCSKALGDANADTVESLANLAGILSLEDRLAEAETMQRQVLTLDQKVFGLEHTNVAHSLNNLADTLNAQGRFQEAEGTNRVALAMRIKLPGDNQLDVAASRFNLATSLMGQGRFAEAEGEARQALAIRRNLLGSGHIDVAGSLNNLFPILLAQNKLPEAEGAQTEALATQRTNLPPEHLDIAGSLINLASVLVRQGKLAAAESNQREALEIQRKVLHTDVHSNVAMSLFNLAFILQAQHKLADAETFARQSLAIRTNLFPRESFEVATSVALVADVLYDQRRLAEAESLQRDELAVWRNLLAREPRPTATLASSRIDAFSRLTRTLLAEEKYADAQSLAQEWLATGGQESPNDWQTFNARGILGASLAGQKKFAEAERHLLAAYKGLEQRAGSIPAEYKSRLSETVERIVHLYEASGRPEQASEWRKKLEPTK
jgi:tetratricopeptide (TPR) repeat protein